MADVVNRRRKIVVNPRLQFRYLTVPLVVTLTTSVCLLALFLVEARSLKLFAGKDAAIQQEITRVQLMAVGAVVLVLVAHVAFIFWLGLMASHKVAGPLFRLKAVMRQVAAGDRKTRIRLRRGDELTDVAEIFNEMMDAISGEKAAAGSSERPGPGGG